MKITSKSQVKFVLTTITLAMVTPASVASPEAKEGNVKSPASAKSVPTVLPTEYPDVPPGHWATSAVNALSRAGYIEGFPDGTFRGDKPLTRYEYAVSQDINIDRWGPSTYEQALRTDLNQVIERLTALENRFKILEDKLKVADTPIVLNGVTPARTSLAIESTIESELQSLHNDFRMVTAETRDVLNTTVQSE